LTIVPAKITQKARGRSAAVFAHQPRRKLDAAGEGGEDEMATEET
jgi:hypothetical protein